MSVVVPVYRAQKCLRPLYDRLVSTLEGMSVTFELVFVEDCGGDGSWEALCELAAQDARVNALQLSRNFGQHAAITAGMEQAEGEWIVLMDCDLQDPPEEIPGLFEATQDGTYDVVLVRRNLKRSTLGKRIGAAMYFRAMNTFAQARLDGEYGCFSLISRQVRDGFLAFHDVQRHYLLILGWMGFPTTSVDIVRDARFEGESSYSLRQLMALGFNGMFFQTTVLLRWIVYLGFAISASGLVGAIWLIAYRFLNEPMAGWTSLIVVVLLMGGFTITCLGIVGLYVGAVFDQAKQRPLYLVARRATGPRLAPVEPDQQSRSGAL